MEKITIVEFYKRLSVILSETRNYKNTKKEFDELMELAKLSNLGVNIDPSILQIENLKKFDEEFSYEETYEEESSTDDDGSSY
jgi:hypothetical protein